MGLWQERCLKRVRISPRNRWPRRRIRTDTYQGDIMDEKEIASKNEQGTNPKARRMIQALLERALGMNALLCIVRRSCHIMSISRKA